MAEQRLQVESGPPQHMISDPDCGAVAPLSVGVHSEPFRAPTVLPDRGMTHDA